MWKRQGIRGTQSREPQAAAVQLGRGGGDPWAAGPEGRFSGLRGTPGKVLEQCGVKPEGKELGFAVPGRVDKS